jgi:hypothetical protein
MRSPTVIPPFFAIALVWAWPWGDAPAHADSRYVRDVFAWVDPQTPPITIAVGSGPTSYHYVARREPSGVTADLHAAMIDGGGHADRYCAYAAGDDGVVLRRTERGGWMREATPTRQRLRALLAPGDDVDEPEAAEIYAVGDAGTVLRRSKVGIWTTETVPTTVDLYDIVRAHRRLYAVGDRGTLLERRGGAWYLIVTHTEADLRQFDGRIAVGRGGAILDCTSMGRAWSGGPGPPLACVPRPSPTDADLLAIERSAARWRAYGAGGTVVHAAQRDPLVAELDPPIAGGATVTAVSALKGSLMLPQATAATYVDPAIAVGAGGTIDFVGDERAHVVLPGAPDLLGVAIELFDAFAVGASGVIVHLQAVELDILHGSLGDEEEWSKLPVTLGLDAAYQRATDGTQLAALQGTVRYDVRDFCEHIGCSYSELTGSIGGVSGVRAAYAVTARVGDQFTVSPWCRHGTCPEHLIGVSAGVALDRAGDRIPRAWTLPVDAYWYWPTGTRFGNHMKLGAVGGVSWQLSGVDRGFGWHAGLDLSVRWGAQWIFGASRGSGALDFPHLHVGAGVQRLAGHTFLGLSIGFWSKDRYDAPWI